MTTLYSYSRNKIKKIIKKKTTNKQKRQGITSTIFSDEIKSGRTLGNKHNIIYGHTSYIIYIKYIHTCKKKGNSKPYYLRMFVDEARFLSQPKQRLKEGRDGGGRE